MAFNKLAGALAGKKSGLKSRPPDLGVNIANSTLFTNASTKRRGSGSRDDAPAAAAAPEQKSDEEVLDEYVSTLYSAYRPEKLSYTQRTKEELLAEIGAWLRPGYDAAIAARSRATKSYQAELDADAISRGMGASTYVTDMKYRQQRAEAEDLQALETDYAAALARQLSDALNTEQERALEVAAFNAENENAAYLKAYDMALTMFQAYKARQGAGGGAPVRRSSGGGSSARTTSAENCEAFLAGLSGRERREVYSASSPSGANYRAELIASVGSRGYVELMKKYPADNRI